LIQKLDILASCHSFTPFISSEAINLLISSVLYIGVQKSQLNVHHSPSWTLRAVSILDKNLDNEPCLHVIQYCLHHTVTFLVTEVIQKATLPPMQVSVSSENNPPLQDSVQNISVLAKHEGKLVPVYTINGSG